MRLAHRWMAVSLGLVLVAVPAEPESPRDGGPADAVWAMLFCFANRNASGYSNHMTDDYLFTSDDPAFVERHPGGMTRQDEWRFVRKLFDGGPEDPEGNRLPTATHVEFEEGEGMRDVTFVRGGEAMVLLDHHHVLVTLSDGSTLDLGSSRCRFDVVLTEAGWRVKRWTETVDRVANGQTRTRAAQEEEPPIDSDSLAAAAAAVPYLLAMKFRSQRKDAMVFELALPREGGVLETFDVMGRRIVRRDLSGLPRGRHVVTLSGSDHPSGVYWARLRQADGAVTRKVVWVK